jgi:excinuclease ABC subunit C
MKIIRRHFPYCTCLRPHLRDCLNAQIGKCPGFCCKKNENEIHPSLTRQRREYLNNIKKIKVILCGKKPAFAKNFDEAKEHAALEKIFEHQLYIFAEGIASRKQNTFAPAAKVSSPSAISRSEKENERTKRNHLRDVPANRFIPLQKINRVECYDISNFAGKEAVGAMTVLMKKEGFWQSDKSSYRKFKIKTAPTRDDPRMIYEVVSRRLNHPEWPYPDLIIIDGGITQLSAAQKAISNSQFPISKKIRIIGFAKPNKQIVGWNNPPEEIKKLAERAIYQTHNFVIRYHRKVRNKELFGIIK